MWELDHKQGWEPKNWCFRALMLKKTWESLGLQWDQTINPKGDQPWIFIGSTDAKAPILWPPNAKSQLNGKDPDSGKDWGQEGKEMTEDEMVEWHQRLSGYELEQAPGDGEGKGSLACCSPRGHKKWTQLSNWTITTTFFKNSSRYFQTYKGSHQYHHF